MNSFGAVMIAAIVLFVALALAFRLASRRAEKTGVGSAQGFISGAALANTAMFALQHPESKVGGSPDQEVLPPLPRMDSENTTNSAS